MTIENFESRLKMMENALAEVQNSVDVNLAKVFNELKENPKGVAKKVAKLSIESHEGLMKMFPTESIRFKAWWDVIKKRLIKWGVPSMLIFLGYVLKLLLAG